MIRLSSISIQMFMKLFFILCHVVSCAAASFAWVGVIPSPSYPIRNPPRQLLDRPTKPLVFFQSLKTDQTTTESSDTSNNVPTLTPASDTSIKVRALASFISMSMLESMLAAGMSIDKIVGSSSMTSSTSIDTNDSSAAWKPTEEPSIDPLQSTIEFDLESSTPLHHKEGDRIISMQDNFDTDIIPSVMDAETDTVPSSIFTSELTPSTNLSKVTRVINNQEQLLLIPNIPSVISTAFGRPLPIIREHVTPLQPPPPQPASETETTITATTTELNDTNIPSDTVDDTNSTNNSTDETTMTMKIVTDEDPYGE